MRTETTRPNAGQTDTRFPTRIRVDRTDQLPVSAPYLLRFEHLMETVFLAAFAEGGSRF